MVAATVLYILPEFYWLEPQQAYTHKTKDSFVLSPVFLYNALSLFSLRTATILKQHLVQERCSKLRCYSVRALKTESFLGLKLWKALRVNWRMLVIKSKIENDCAFSIIISIWDNSLSKLIALLNITCLLTNIFTLRDSETIFRLVCLCLSVEFLMLYYVEEYFLDFTIHLSQIVFVVY